MDLLTDLRAIHATAWDADANLLRMLPGMKPDDEVEPSLHTIRESALGAYLDLADGHVDRAVLTLDTVLGHQFDAPGYPWHGSFRVRAEQDDPPLVDAVEWFHYDPNWRQFLGVILAVCVTDFAESLGAQRCEKILAAIDLALRGEPIDRIPDWYTNPNMLHAWLQAWYGQQTSRPEHIDAALIRARMLHERLRHFGDVDEYNSPTYDGIDLFAAALWVSIPPTTEFEQLGAEFITVIADRLGVLYEPSLGAICGPHIRAYGLGLTRYVSLLGLWLALSGQPTGAVLPLPLNADTVHIHDLYFVPLFQRVGNSVLPQLKFEGSLPRQHVQRFDDIIAESTLTDGIALGAERGRLPDFAKDQYVPVTAHAADADGITQWLGFKLGWLTTIIDATLTSSAGLTGHFNAAENSATTDLLIASSDVPSFTGAVLHLPPIEVTFSRAPVSISTTEYASGVSTRLGFDERSIDFQVAVTPPQDTPES